MTSKPLATPDTLNSKKMRSDIFVMIIPIILSAILEMSVGFVSMALIGDLGAVAISAMALSQRVRGIIWSVFKGIGIGLQVIVAQSTGARDDLRTKLAIAQTLMSIFVLACGFVLTMLFFPNQWLSIFNPNEGLKIVGVEVLRVISLGLPFLGIVIIASSGLQGKGDTMTPLFINGFMNVINIVLGYWFVQGGLGLKGMGLIGAAYAMVLAQALAAFVGLWLLVGPRGLLNGLHVKKFTNFFTPLSKLVFTTGLPSVLESLFWNVSSVVLAGLILSYGNEALAAYQLGFQAESLAFMPAVGFQVAATAFVGKYLAAKQPGIARLYFREIISWSIVASIIGSVILIFLPRQVLGLMTSDQELIKIATSYMIICGIAQAPQNIAGVIGGALRGAGYTGLPMITSGIAIYFVRIPLAFMSSIVFKWPVNVIFIAIAIDMFLRLLINGFFYYRQNIYEKPKIL